MSKRKLVLCGKFLLLTLIFILGFALVSAGDFNIYNKSDVGQFYFSVNGTLGRVGIGTATPTHKLNVVGNSNFTGDVNITGNVTARGSLLGTPGIYLRQGSYGSDYFYSNTFQDAELPVEIHHKWLMDGVERMTLSSLGDLWLYDDLTVDGDVGIGTAAPTHELNVVGDANITGDIWSQGINISRNWTLDAFTNWGSNWYNHTLSTFSTYNSTWDNNWVNVFAYNHTSSVFSTWNSTWDESGWVIDNYLADVDSGWNRSGTDVFLGYTGDSVGIGTVNPSHKLNVVGNANFTGNLTVDTIFAKNYSSQSPINFINTSGSSLMTILETGEVGIGTTDPSGYKLKIERGTISGAFYAQYDADHYGTIGASDTIAVYGRAQGSSLSNIGVHGYNYATAGAGTVQYGVLGWSAGNTVDGKKYGVYGESTGTADKNIGVYGTASGGTENYAAIFYAGNVGIGTLAPTQKLHVEGNTNITGNIHIGGNFSLDGEVVGQESSRVKVTKNDAQSILNSVSTILEYDDEVYDTLGEFNSSHQFTATEAGYYFVSAGLLFASVQWNPTELGQLFLRKNGNAVYYFHRHEQGATATYYLHLHGTHILYLEAGDYLDVMAFQGTGAALNTHDNVAFNHFDIQRLRSSVTIGAGGIAAGAIVAFNSETCPTGWVPADGTSGTPDLRGIFVRGAGTSGAYQMANGTYYTAPFGTSMLDVFQSHWHQLQGLGQVLINTGATYGVPKDGGGTSELNIKVKDPTTAGAAYGTPRTGGETAPASYALTYCMKTTEDTNISNTIWGTSGDNVLVQNTSKDVMVGGNVVIDHTAPITNAIRVTGEYQLTADNELDYSGSIAGTTTVTVSELPANTVSIFVHVKIARLNNADMAGLLIKRNSGDTLTISLGKGGHENLDHATADGHLQTTMEFPTDGNTFYVTAVYGTVNNFDIIGYKVGE